MSEPLIFDSDDFGVNHVISQQTESHDCRDVLLEFRRINPNFKATLFTIPGEVTAELLAWCQKNRDWIEVAVHGFFHQTNTECEKLTYDDFAFFMSEFKDILDTVFVKGFKAPGWQISDDVLRWLKEHDYWVADQPYNDSRRPEGLKSYVIRGDGWPKNELSTQIHTHTWNCVGNGVYELYEPIIEKIKDKERIFKFVSEVVK